MAVAASVVLTGCSSASNNAADGADAGETLTIVTPDTSITWSLDNGFGGYEQANNLQATLVRKPYVDSVQEGAQQQDLYTYEPYLAEGYEVSDDGLTYTFTLKEAVSAAGNTLTADDVIWSFDRKFNTPTSIVPGVMAPSITDPTEQIKKIDDRTVSFTIPQAGLGATFLALMSDLCGQIFDSTLLEEHVTPEDPYAVKWTTENPNYGFGPYEVSSYTPGVQAVLQAREDWVMGKAPIDTVNVQIVADPGTRANAVRNGDAQLAESITPADSSSLQDDPNVFIPEVDNPNTFLMMPLVTNKAPFDNPLVRQAMAYATPYQQIIDSVYRGLAVRQGSGFLLQDAPGYTNEGQPEYAYDPERSRQLLTEAGFPDGLSFSLAVSAADPDTREAALQIQTAARDGGFDVQIEQMPASQFADQRSNHTSQAFLLRDYAITLTPPYELLVYTAQDSSNNFADWEFPPFYDALAAGNALPDALSDEAGQAWNAAETIYLEQSPIVFIAQVQPSVALASNLSGFAQRSDNWIDYSNFSFE
ncbi:ABC transporter substrate-binding protein [Rhodococcoides fascians]|uniref:ABC transporter substrate-binding protein n=1 Tax=Rhodococcoides fascians TaxID=1828 RepID=UPI000AC2FC19|nr:MULTISPECIES: ABC transporter substrate-binding protein [Rhodococcus]